MPKLSPVVGRLVLSAAVLAMVFGCARTRRTVVEEEVGGIGTSWQAGQTQAGVWQDQAALSRALEAAMWKLPKEPARICKGKSTRVEVVVFPDPATFGRSEAQSGSQIQINMGGSGSDAARPQSQKGRIQSFVEATAQRRIASLGCRHSNLDSEVKGDAPDSIARFTVSAWGWDVEAVAALTTTVRTRGREVSSLDDDEEGLARIRARATVHLDVYSKAKMESASADGSSKWRVLTGKDARTWPLDQLPLIYEPPSRVFSDSYEEER